MAHFAYASKAKRRSSRYRPLNAARAVSSMPGIIHNLCSVGPPLAICRTVPTRRSRRRLSYKSKLSEVCDCLALSEGCGFHKV
jgi:hypothetical protein